MRKITNSSKSEEAGFEETIDQDELVDLVVGGVGGATADVWVEGGDKKSHLALDTNHKKVKWAAIEPSRCEKVKWRENEEPNVKWPNDQMVRWSDRDPKNLRESNEKLQIQEKWLTLQKKEINLCT